MAMFEKHICSSLIWVNSNSLICDDGAGLCWDFELFSGKFENGSERCLFGHCNNSVREFTIRGENDFEGDFSRHCCCLRCCLEFAHPVLCVDTCLLYTSPSPRD
eukprot:TRINITY_DN1558_c0_g1_i1.p1 TRINITY_DN1558_c0_g1~~TRINITY_DN1558_c0_g1_i1.p1  ORF type:complete len:104 (+),score=10.99 TRINITY_DN1558_c0_g1_i1:97-408(+)